MCGSLNSLYMQVFFSALLSKRNCLPSFSSPACLLFVSTTVFCPKQQRQWVIQSFICLTVFSRNAFSKDTSAWRQFWSWEKQRQVPPIIPSGSAKAGRNRPLFLRRSSALITLDRARAKVPKWEHRFLSLRLLASWGTSRIRSGKMSRSIPAVLKLPFLDQHMLCCCKTFQYFPGFFHLILTVFTPLF